MMEQEKREGIKQCLEELERDLLNAFPKDSFLHVKGGEQMLHAIVSVRGEFSALSLETSSENDHSQDHLMQGMILVIEQGIVLTPFLHALVHGRLALIKLTELQELLRLHLSETNAYKDEHMLRFTFLDEGKTPVFLSTSETVSILSKEGEAELLRQEIPVQLTLQQNLFVVMCYVAVSIMTLALQPIVSGLTALLVAPVGFALALKIGSHDLRVGQIGLYLRLILRSPYEIVRRVLFHRSRPSFVETRVLEDQHIDLSQPVMREAARLRPRLSMHELGNRLCFMIFDLTALVIAVLRTYPAALHFDLLTLFMWCIGIISSLGTWMILERKRFR